VKHKRVIDMNERILRRTLRFNAGFTSVCVLVLAFAEGWFSELFQTSDWVRIGLAWGLTGFAGLVWMTSRADPLPKKGIGLIAWSDIIWVVGSAVLLALNYPNYKSSAIVLVIGVALVVGLFGLLQLTFLKRQ
jgi:hypothetical protein